MFEVEVSSSASVYETFQRELGDPVATPVSAAFRQHWKK